MGGSKLLALVLAASAAAAATPWPAEAQCRLCDKPTTTRPDPTNGDDIHLEIEAKLPRSGVTRRLRLDNHHHQTIAAYQVNCLIPTDRNIQITQRGVRRGQQVLEPNGPATDGGHRWR